MVSAHFVCYRHSHHFIYQNIQCLSHIPTPFSSSHFTRNCLHFQGLKKVRSLRNDAVAHLLDRDAPRRLFLLSPPLFRLFSSVIRCDRGRPRGRLGLLPLAELVLGHGVRLTVVLWRDGIRIAKGLSFVETIRIWKTICRSFPYDFFTITIRKLLES